MTNDEWYKLERVIKSARTPGQHRTAKKFAEQLLETRPEISQDEFRFMKRAFAITLTLGMACAIGLIILFFRYVM